MPSVCSGSQKMIVSADKLEGLVSRIIELERTTDSAPG
jgi:hypothetical protein